MPEIRAVTLDLDDTLWPIWPAIEHAERRLQAWLSEHAPATARAFDIPAMRTLREAVAQEWAGMAHDVGAIRRECVRRALQAGGEDPNLAEPAYEVFLAARHDVTLFDDVEPALRRLAQRVPVVAVSNGNADLARIGIDHHFVGALSAPAFGVGKPDARIFHAACELAGVDPARVLHVGDDWELDVQGALGAGLRAAWVRRPGLASALAQDPGHPQVLTVQRLDELLALVEQGGTG